ncbi:MAG TPA: YihY/virulence factor BrkB family protein [Chloroflexota bacterium]|nr:YihY/virulence factor BrkB family protein [Chloroflexota bacterium]
MNERQKRRIEGLKPYLQKVLKDNIGFLASVVAWNTLTSMVPIVIGLTAISGFILQGDRSLETQVIAHLSNAFRGVLTTADLSNMVHSTTKHSGLLGILALVGVLWGGANIGGAISTTFQPIFEVSGRNFIKEKLLDIGMIFVIAILMVVIVVATTFSAIVHQLFSGFPLSSASSFIVGTAVSLAAGTVLFGAIYIAFPNAQPRLKIRNVWRGAVLAAVLFEALTFIWPIYAHFAHFSRYGAVILPILVLTAWIYFFSMILMIGAEVVAIAAIREANRENVVVGPEPQNTVPQHRVLRKV